MSCKHSSWLNFLQFDEEVFVEVSDRPQQLLRQHKDFSDDPCGCLLLIGNERKSDAVDRFRGKEIQTKHSRRSNTLDMWFHASTNSQRASFLVAESSVGSHKQPRSTRCSPATCHQTVTYSLPPHSCTAQNKIEKYRHRVIFPFVDTICIFVDDLGGMGAVAQLVCTWAENGQIAIGTLPPSLILVIDEGDTTAAIEEFERQCRLAANVNIAQKHYRIEAISLTLRRKVKVQQRRQWHRFQRQIFDNMTVMHRMKHLQHRLYSFQHLIAYMKIATHSLRGAQQPFDFIVLSRRRFPISQEAESCFAAFLNQIHTIEQLHHFAIPIISSCILFDHYRRNMHYFTPQEVFNTLYKSVCQQSSSKTFQAANGTQWLMMPSAFINLLRQEVTSQFHHLREAESTVIHHKQTLKLFKNYWSCIYSQNTCFSCLMRRPKTRLACGHWICRSCFNIFGDGSRALPHLRSCVLCEKNTLGIKRRQKPDTATVRIMCIDGGGSRGGIPLKFIQSMQERVNLPCPIQNNFDIIYGTSSGAISACALGVKGWDVRDCLAICRTIAKRIFQPRFPSLSSITRLSQVNIWLQNILSLILDSRYSSKNLEVILQEIFGPYTTMADWDYAHQNDIHVGFPITTIEDAGTVLVNNYNGIGHRAMTEEYETLNSEDIPLWQALRATTAAPFFFKPQTIGEFEYQDGGMVGHNNPVGLAIEEARRLFPETPQPSLVVSFGTGSSMRYSPKSKRIKQYKIQKMKKTKKNRARFASRLFQAFLKQGDSNVAWKQVLSDTKSHTHGEYFRFDVEFEGNGPSLDDVTDLEGLEELAQDSIVSSPTMDRLAQCIRAENFFFELDGEPLYRNGVFECSGRIFCRFDPGSDELEVLLAQLDQKNAYFTVSGCRLTGTLQNSLSMSGNFCKWCKFYVKDDITPFSISLTEGAALPCNISGSSFTLEWLRDVQQIDAPFGRKDYL